jgi:hypothetical protein
MLNKEICLQCKLSRMNSKYQRDMHGLMDRYWDDGVIPCPAAPTDDREVRVNEEPPSECLFILEQRLA